MLALEEVSRGPPDEHGIDTRDLVRRSRHHVASAVIVCQYNPGRCGGPTEMQRQLSDELTTELAGANVRVLDRVVVGEGGVFSFVENGLL